MIFTFFLGGILIDLASRNGFIWGFIVLSSFLDTLGFRIQLFGSPSWMPVKTKGIKA
jgi:hypothetical protein